MLGKIVISVNKNYYFLEINGFSRKTTDNTVILDILNKTKKMRIIIIVDTVIIKKYSNFCLSVSFKKGFTCEKIYTFLINS